MLRAVRSTLLLSPSNSLRINTLIAITSSQSIKEMWSSKSLLIRQRRIEVVRRKGVITNGYQEKGCQETSKEDL
jgi:dUTPase